jgi:hypothetical protein
MLAAALAVATLADDARAQVARGSVVVTRDAWPSCAGDGLPPPLAHSGQRVPYSAQLSAFVEGWGAAYTGRDVRLTDLDAVDGSNVYLATARLAACGQLRTGWGPLSWGFGYEPYSVDEAGQPDRREWGRLTEAEIGIAPWRWLVLSVGVRKVSFSFGHDEPIEMLALPVRPYVSQSIAPDRRLGLTLDDDFGVARVVIGIYEGNRDLSITTNGGFLLSARLVAEPLGPVGNTVSTAFDPEYWRPRPRFAFNASILVEYRGGDTTYALAADGVLHWGPVGLVGEYIYSSGTTVEAPVRLAARPAPARSGLYVEAAAMLWRPWIELTVRYDWLDNPGQAGQQFHAFTAGATVYAVKQYLRLQALYTHKLHFDLLPNRPDIQDDVLLFAASLSLEKTF